MYWDIYRLMRHVLGYVSHRETYWDTYRIVRCVLRCVSHIYWDKYCIVRHVLGYVLHCETYPPTLTNTHPVTQTFDPYCVTIPLVVSW